MNATTIHAPTKAEIHRLAVFSVLRFAIAVGLMLGARTPSLGVNALLTLFGYSIAAIEVFSTIFSKGGLAAVRKLDAHQCELILSWMRDAINPDAAVIRQYVSEVRAQERTFLVEDFRRIKHMVDSRERQRNRERVDALRHEIDTGTGPNA